MAVKGTILKYRDAPSVDQRWKESAGGAESIKSARIDPTGDGWLFDRGLEPWMQFPAVLTSDTSPYMDTVVDSQFIWTKQSTGQVYHFIEQGGELYFLWGCSDNIAVSAFWDHKTTIATGRRTRKVGDVGTQYIPYGNRLLILNGYDKPIWFYGDNRHRLFGFTIATPQLELINVNPIYGAVSDLQEGLPRPNFAETRAIGLGDTENADRNSFSYRMSFVSDTGSESPLGLPSAVDWTNDATYKSRRGVLVNEVPTGGKGIVARRIYRTKNMRSRNGLTSNEQLYYLVKQLDDNSTTEFIDVIPDSSLVTPAPSLTDSDAISTTYQFGAAWNNRLFLGGGAGHPTRIIYSEAGLPEQFGAFNYFDIGSSTGGHITKIIGFYNSLLIFRERAIDVIRQGSQGLTISSLSPDVGTTASNTIQIVPGVGIVFLNKDGLYAATGGLEGGSQVRVVKISDLIGKAIQSINVAALPNCCAAYSKKEKEYWLHYVRKGETIPTRGIVLHTYNKSFSFRGPNTKDNEYLWSFSTIQTDPNGNFIFGTRPDWRLLNGSPSNPNTTGAFGSLVGLQVWSGAPYWGKVLSASESQGTVTYTANNRPLDKNIWESNWINFGNSAIKHRVFNVEMEMVSYGDNPVVLEWGHDYDVTWYSAGEQKISKSEILYTTEEDPVFGPQDLTVSKAPFVIGEDLLRGGRIVVIRWDVNTKLVDNFRFRVSQQNGKPFHILGFSINHNSRDQLPLNQRARTGRNQPY